MTQSNSLLLRLRGGDRRSIGQSNQLVTIVLKRPALFATLIRGFHDPDPLVRMRAADAAEKVSLAHPELLKAHKAELIHLTDDASEQELRWHLAQMVVRLPLTSKERQRTAATLRRYLEDHSSIVKTCALQALADLALQDESLRPEVADLLLKAGRDGTPAMKARSRKLLKQFVE